MKGKPNFVGNCCLLKERKKLGQSIQVFRGWLLNAVLFNFCLFPHYFNDMQRHHIFLNKLANIPQEIVFKHCGYQLGLMI